VRSDRGNNMTVYPSFASTASLPSALDESANHVDAGEDFEAVSRLVSKPSQQSRYGPGEYGRRGLTAR
jgi:hypothetical protein